MLIVVYPYTDMCKAPYTQYFPESCEQNHMQTTRLWFEPKTFATLDQFLTN